MIALTELSTSVVVSVARKDFSAETVGSPLIPSIAVLRVPAAWSKIEDKSPPASEQVPRQYRSMKGVKKSPLIWAVRASKSPGTLARIDTKDGASSRLATETDGSWISETSFATGAAKQKTLKARVARAEKTKERIVFRSRSMKKEMLVWGRGDTETPRPHRQFIANGIFEVPRVWNPTQMVR